MVSPTPARDTSSYSRAVLKSFGGLLHQLLEFTFSEGGSCSNEKSNLLLAPLQNFKSVLSAKLASLDSDDDPSTVGMEFAHLDFAGFGPTPPTATPVAHTSDDVSMSTEEHSGSVATPTPPHLQQLDNQESDFVDMESSSTSGSPRGSSKRPYNRKLFNNRPSAPNSPSGKKTNKRRHIQEPPPTGSVVIDVASLQNIIAAQFDTKFGDMKKVLKEDQSAQIDSFKQEIKNHHEAFTKETTALKDAIDDHDARISANATATAAAMSKLDDLSSRVLSLEDLSRSLSSFTPGSSSTPTPSSSLPPHLSFSDRVDSDLSARISKARDFQAQNTSSFVIFSARQHLDNMSPETFAQRVAERFGGKTAVVKEIAWLGFEKTHLKVTLTLPLAEAIGEAFFRDRQTLRVPYGLAPCRTKLLREAISRMTKTLKPLRHLLPEILAERVSALQASFLGQDYFDAMDFLYPAIRLSTGQIIPVSYLVNNPDLAALTLPVDPTLVIPGPQQQKTA